MKRLFIFALMTMAASSSFAISDLMSCINGRVNISTSHYTNDEKTIHLTAAFMVDDIGTFNSVVTAESARGQKTFVGKTADGRDLKLVVQNLKSQKGLKGTLTIQDLPTEEGFICKEQIFFGM
jgi:hypothetical protein